MIRKWWAEHKRRKAIRGIKRQIVMAEYRQSNGEQIPDYEWADYDNRLKCLGDRTGGVR